ncbi:MAG: FAD-dependent oxidoreductase [Burkholderiales bacterium]|nr:FAD-dependent oxidoreductase [Burkholderiales bacterium]
MAGFVGPRDTAAAPATDRATAEAQAHAGDLLRWLDGGAPALTGQAAQRVAVVGGGISGLGAAWALQGRAQVSVFEAEPRLGGHANTVDVELDGVRHGVDTGFLVCNVRTYPLLLRLFDDLGVELAPSRMGFSVQHRGLGLEWAGNDLNSVFAQRRNLLRPAFLRMLIELLRFNRLTTALAERGEDAALQQPLADFLREHRFSAMFRDAYLLPMIACIWSCPAGQMLDFPVGTLIRFCHNHGLLQVNERPQWLTVKGGSREYVQRLRARLSDVREASPVRAVQRQPKGGARLWLDGGRHEDFDAVILACHSDQALALLSDASAPERELLGAIRYQRNRAVLHLDAGQLPRRRSAWAAWNFETDGQVRAAQRPVCLHYLINELQPLPWSQPVVVSMNPLREPKQVLREFDYAHPVFDEGAVAAQRRLPALQGQGGVWFAGAWTRYGFHEDGLLSGLQAARAFSEVRAS